MSRKLCTPAHVCVSSKQFNSCSWFVLMKTEPNLVMLMKVLEIWFKEFQQPDYVMRLMPYCLLWCPASTRDWTHSFHLGRINDQATVVLLSKSCGGDSTGAKSFMIQLPARISHHFKPQTASTVYCNKTFYVAFLFTHRKPSEGWQGVRRLLCSLLGRCEKTAQTYNRKESNRQPCPCSDSS